MADNSSIDGVTVLGVQFASIKHLFAPLTDRTNVMFVHFNDWLNELRRMVQPSEFVDVEPLASADWREWRYPPGWANRLSPWIMPKVAQRVRQAWRAREWKNPRLVVTFPYFLPLARAIGPERIVYYAVDNYQAYWPDRAAVVYAQENELTAVAAATIAASSQLAEWFRGRVPTAAAKVRHVSNGVRSDMVLSTEVIKDGSLPLQASLAHSFGAADGAVVGCYGNIASGYGGEFLAAVIERSPRFRFLLMGRYIGQQRSSDKGVVERLRNFPNVIMTGHLREPESLQTLRQCDVMIITPRQAALDHYSCPNRLWT